MSIRAESGYGRGGDRFVLLRDHSQLLFCTWSAVGLRGLSVVVGDEPADLALAANLAVGLRSEFYIEHVVADLKSLMRPLRVVVREPKRHDAVELLGREAYEVIQASASPPHRRAAFHPTASPSWSPASGVQDNAVVHPPRYSGPARSPVTLPFSRDAPLQIKTTCTSTLNPPSFFVPHLSIMMDCLSKEMQQRKC